MIEFLPAKNGGRTLKKDGVYLLSLYHPFEDAERQVKLSLSGKERPYAVCFGSGLGYFGRALISQGIAEGDILTFEPDAVLERDFRENRYLGRLLAPNDFLPGILEEALIQRKRPVLIATESYKKAFGKIFLELETYFTESLRKAAENLKISAYFSRLWFINYCRNLASVLKRQNRFFYPVFQKKIDTPVLIVSAGPSLNRHLSGIRRNRDKIFILSVLSAARTLQSAGICPDAVVMSDAGVGNVLHAEGLPEEIPVFASVYSNSATLSKMKNPVVFYDFSKEFKHPSFRLDSPSVTLDAGLLAGEIARGTLGFCGFDLSYSPLEGSHSKENAFVSQRVSSFSRLRPLYGSLTSFFGRMDLFPSEDGLYTHPQFLLVKKAAEELFKGCFNIEGGLPLLGMLPLSSITDIPIGIDTKDSHWKEILCPLSGMEAEIRKELSAITDLLESSGSLVSRVFVRENLSGKDCRAEQKILVKKIIKLT